MIVCGGGDGSGDGVVLLSDDHLILVEGWANEDGVELWEHGLYFFKEFDRPFDDCMLCDVGEGLRDWIAKMVIVVLSTELGHKGTFGLVTKNKIGQIVMFLHLCNLPIFIII